jgi:hypothetical protein
VLDLLTGKRSAARSLVVTDLNAQRPQFDLGCLFGARHVPASPPITSPISRNATRLDRPCMLPLGRLGRELFALLNRLFDGSYHVESSFRQVIIFAFAESLEAFDGVLQIDQLAGGTREHFRDVERL